MPPGLVLPLFSYYVRPIIFEMGSGDITLAFAHQYRRA